MKHKKEITVAIVIGFILALIVTGGILRARRAINSLKTLPQKTGENLSPAPAEKKDGALFLDLTTLDNTATTSAQFLISGKTLPQTYIAIIGEVTEYLIVPNEFGAFSQDISLTKGANIITIKVFQSDGTRIEKKLNAVYTTAEI